MSKQSYAVELTKEQVDWIKKAYSVTTNTQVRQVLEFLVKKELPVSEEAKNAEGAEH